MYFFPHTPAVRSHMDAQTAFLNEMSTSMFHSFHQMCDLNIQLVRTLVEEGTLASQQLLSSGRQADLLSAASARAQPTAEKLRAYQQHLARLAAEAQVELARVTEQHVQNTTRTARALVDEVAHSAAEETESRLRAQQEAMRNAVDPFARPNGETQRGQQGMGQGGPAGRSSSQGGRPEGAQTH